MSAPAAIEFELELKPERGVVYAESLLPALRDYVATSPAGEHRLVVIVPTREGRRTLKFGGTIAEPDRDTLEAIVAEHKITRGKGGAGD